MSIQRLSNSGQSGFRYKSLIAGITPVASVPVIGEATALTFSTASVTFTAPGAYAATTFTATSSPGGLTGTSATSPITVTGLSEQTAYTFTVTATNATGTSGASAASNSITTPAAFTPDSGYDALATVTLSASASTVTFAGIPSGYKHLQIRAIARGTYAATNLNLCIQFNNDTTNSYTYHQLLGDGSSATASGGVAQAFGFAGRISQANATGSVFGASVIDILDYTNTNKNTTIRALGGYDANGNGYATLMSSAYIKTDAVTSIQIFGNLGDLVTYSSFALYGVK